MNICKTAVVVILTGQRAALCCECVSTVSVILEIGIVGNIYTVEGESCFYLVFVSIFYYFELIIAETGVKIGEIIASAKIINPDAVSVDSLVNGDAIVNVILTFVKARADVFKELFSESLRLSNRQDRRFVDRQNNFLIRIFVACD